LRNLSTLNKYFRKNKKKLFLGFFFILVSDLAQVLIPIFLKNGIDALKNNFNTEQLISNAIYIVAAAAVSGVFRFSIRETIIVVSREIEYDLLNDFWKHIQKLPFNFFKTHSTGEMMALGTNDISAVRMYLGPAVMYSVDTIIKFILIIGVLFSINWQLTLYILLPLPISSFLVYWISKKVHKKFTLIQEKFAELTTKAQEVFDGIRVVKSYTREDYENKQFEKLSDEYLNRNLEMAKVRALFMPVLFLFVGITLIIVIWVGGYKVINNNLTIGELTAFVVYLGLLTWPMIAFGWVANIIQQAEASMKRLNNIFKEKTESQSDDEFRNFSENRKFTIKSLEFRNISLKYSNSKKMILKNINFKVSKNEVLAIVGHTGSGKTSIINLIPRLFDATEGEVLINDKDIKKYPIALLRKSIGIATQESFLFSDTIKNNLLFGVDSQDENLIDKLSKISRLKNDITQFPEEYETVLGERGITMSGGQKQRTAIARALAINPEILILDDAFSAVDTQTEEEILNELKSNFKNRISLIISHRISTVKHADKIIVIKDGTILESGTHEELLKLAGIYANLHHKQLLEEELKGMS